LSGTESKFIIEQAYYTVNTVRGAGGKIGRGQKLNEEEEAKGAASMLYSRILRRATPALAALLVVRVKFKSPDLNNV
jgi:hypothetical protein